MPDRPTDPRAFFFDCGGVASITPCQPPSRYAASVPRSKAQTEDQKRAERIMQQSNPATADPLKGTLNARAKGGQPPQFAAKLSTPQAKLSATPPAQPTFFSAAEISAIYQARRRDQPVKPPAPKPGQVRLSAEGIYAARRKAIEEVNHA